jgi:hypothetical protein
MIVGTITAREQRGRVRVAMTANTEEVLGIDLDANAAWEFACQLREALGEPPR